MKTTFRASLLIAIIVGHLWLFHIFANSHGQRPGNSGSPDTNARTDTSSINITAKMKVRRTPQSATDTSHEESLTQISPDHEAQFDAPEPLAHELKSSPDAHLPTPEAHPKRATSTRASQTSDDNELTSKPEHEKKKRSYEHHFEQMVREYKTRKARYIPQLCLQYDTPNLHRAALNFFGFRLIARPKGSNGFYFERDPGGNVVKRSGQCPYTGWCLEALPGDESYFSTLALREGVAARDLQLFYKSSNNRGEAYLRGVQLSAITDAGLRVADVASVEGIMCKVGPDRFSLNITRIKER